METPKLVWIAENLPLVWADKNISYFDLPDFLVYKATNCNHIRSRCTTVCKWTFLAHDQKQGWQDDFFSQIGLQDLVSNYAQIGSIIRPVGEPVANGVTEEASSQLHLPIGTAVAVSIIDAHAGGIGIIGAKVDNGKEHNLCSRLVVVSGTSACHMTMTKEPVFIHGM